MFNQCPRRVREPKPKQLPKVQPSFPNEHEGKWNHSPDESMPTSQGKISPSTTPEHSSEHSADSEKQPYEQELSNVIQSPKSCGTSQSSLPSPQPLGEGPYLSRLDKWQNNVAQAELRVALRYSMGLLMMQALRRRSAFSEAGDESQIDLKNDRCLPKREHANQTF